MAAKSTSDIAGKVYDGVATRATDEAVDASIVVERLGFPSVRC